MAYGAMIDNVMHIRTLMAEMLLYDFFVGTNDPPSHFMPVAGITDCRSLYDLLCKESQLGQTVEKRLAIDLLIIKDLIEPLLGEEGANDYIDVRQVVRWTPTVCQLADALTKVRPSHELREKLIRGRLCLRDHC